MQLDSPAKVNLSLKVGPLDSSGYHPVDTLIHLLAFGDTVTIADADRLTVTCSRDLGIDPTENLAYRAAERMGVTFDRPTDVAIHIEKRIPHGAGLGGGSSNAATVVRALAERWQVPLDDERVVSVARELGSDVAAFLAPTACSHLVGRGDTLAASLQARSGLPLVLAIEQGAFASTAAVYRMFDTIGPASPTLPFVNDLADASQAVCEATRRTLEWLRAQPQTDSAQVCGSGAACFAVAESTDDAVQLAHAARDHGFWSEATTLL